MGGGAGFYAGTMPDRSVSRFLANVTRPAPLGSTVLYVDSTSQIKAGDWVRLWMIDAEATRGIYFTNKTDGTGSDNGTIIEETDGSRRRLSGLASFLPGSPQILRQAIADTLADAEMDDDTLAVLKRMALNAAWQADPAFFRGSGSGFHAAALDGTLPAWVYGENLADSGQLDWLGMVRANTPVRFSVRVASVGPDYIVLERALPYLISLDWKPQLYDLGPVQQVRARVRACICGLWSTTGRPWCG